MIMAVMTQDGCSHVKLMYTNSHERVVVKEASLTPPILLLSPPIWGVTTFF
jgi:hypothetical protein